MMMMTTTSGSKVNPGAGEETSSRDHFLLFLEKEREKEIPLCISSLIVWICLSLEKKRKYTWSQGIKSRCWRSRKNQQIDAAKRSKDQQLKFASSCYSSLSLSCMFSFTPDLSSVFRPKTVPLLHHHLLWRKKILLSSVFLLPRQTFSVSDKKRASVSGEDEKMKNVKPVQFVCDVLTANVSCCCLNKWRERLKLSWNLKCSPHLHLPHEWSLSFLLLLLTLEGPDTG